MLAGGKQVRHVQFPKQADCSADSLNAALAQLTQLPQLPALSIDMSFVTDPSSLSLSCLTQLRVLSLHQCKVSPLESLQVLSQLRALKFAGLKQPPESDQLEMLGSRLPGLQYLMLTNCVIVQEQTPQETQHSKTMARRGVADGGLRDGGFGGLPHTSDACKVRAFPSQSAWTSFWCIQIPAAVEFEWQ
eukprot:jgi/Chrzof1/3572/Cz13g00240.t1